MPGYSSSLTFPGVHRGHSSRRRQAHDVEESPAGRRSRAGHSKWECKYHVVFIPKCRRRALYGQLRRPLGEVFHDLARNRATAAIEASLDGGSNFHMLIAIPPKHAVATGGGSYVKWEERPHVARAMENQAQLCWAAFVGAWLFVNGRTNEAVVRAYIPAPRKRGSITRPAAVLELIGRL